MVPNLILGREQLTAVGRLSYLDNCLTKDDSVIKYERAYVEGLSGVRWTGVVVALTLYFTEVGRPYLPCHGAPSFVLCL